MLDTGFSQLLCSEVTRSVKLSNGYTLVFDKLRVKDYAQREDEIVRLRGSAHSKAVEIANLIPEITNPEVREAVLDGLKGAIKEISTRPSFAFIDERLDFTSSPHGESYTLFLCTRRNTPQMKCPEDAVALWESSISEEDRIAILNAVYWASEHEALKNSDSPPDSVATESKETTPAGE